MRNKYNSDYWEKRISAEVWNSYNTLEEKNIKLIEEYRKATERLQLELLKELTELETNKTRTQKYKVERLKSLKYNFEQELNRLTARIEKTTNKNFAKECINIYKQALNITLPLFSQNEDQYTMTNDELIQFLNENTFNGKNFKEYIWGDTEKLQDELDQILKNGLMKGESVASMSYKINNAMNKGLNVAYRLIRTESIHYLNESAIKGYENAGVKYVQWWCAEDERTCPRCGAIHGKIFKIGENPTTQHPNCRCTVIPVIDMKTAKEDYKTAQEEIRKIQKTA